LSKFAIRRFGSHPLRGLEPSVVDPQRECGEGQQRHGSCRGVRVRDQIAQDRLDLGPAPGHQVTR
jgi:hypothetical protein